MTHIISGKDISAQILEELKSEIRLLIDRGITPCLAVVLVGEDPASVIYVRNKRRTCEEIGILSVEYALNKNTSPQELTQLLKKLNQDPQIHGILCQFPLPHHLDEEQVILTISPDKDVDGLHPVNLGFLAMGHPRFISCTPFGVWQLLKRSQIPIAGKHVVVLGRSKLVGRPLSILLSQKGYDATVTVCHSKTPNLKDLTRQADILVAAMGSPELIDASMIKKGAVVIDVGTNRVDDPKLPKGYRLCGDVQFSAVQSKTSAITPVPGGVGPMTIAMLLYNTVNAVRWQNGLSGYDL